MIKCETVEDNRTDVEIDGEANIILKEWVAVTAVFIKALLETGFTEKETKKILLWNVKSAIKETFKAFKEVSK